MSDRVADRRPLESAREALRQARTAVTRATVELAENESHLAMLKRERGNRDAEVLAAERAVATRRATLETLRRGERAAHAALADRLAEWLPPDISQEVSSLGADVPIALFPVRIETRFTAVDGPDRWELKIRVYPDEIAADWHDDALTEREHAAGLEYWHAAWIPGGETAAWERLAAAFRPNRAQWIARALSPENLHERPHGEPQFPTTNSRLRAWARPAEARVLPDRWLAIGYRGGAEVRRAVGRPVRDPLTLTLAPEADDESTDDLSGDGLLVDSAIAWTYDFERAEAEGMALRMALSAEDLRSGFDRLIVLGVKASIATEAGAETLASLLHAHRFTRGLEILRQGSATNHSDETRAAEADQPSMPPPLARTPADDSDGALTARAFGIPASTFEGVAGADRIEQVRARGMNEALWPATIGYFLEQMMAPVVSQGGLALAREHFVAHVRGRGPLPAIRVGNSPYGLLPVATLGSWRSDGRDPLERELVPILRELREVWMNVVAQVPRLHREGDADRELLAVLGQDASAREVRVRAAVGEAYQRNLLDFLGIDDGNWILKLFGRALLDRLGHPEWQPRALGLNFSPEAHRFRHVFAATALSEELPLSFDYVDWIARASVDELRHHRVPDGIARPQTLLYHVLRHAALVEYARLTVDVLTTHGQLQPEERHERELIGIVDRTRDRPTIWQHFETRVPAVTGELSVAEYLRGTHGDALSAAANAYRAALRSIVGIPTAELSRLFTETLDVCSHRLDAWITSVASRRLAQMRARRPMGIHLGGYGWVEELRRTEVPRANGGFVHAPSSAHAATAAVLRNAYLSRPGQDDGRFAIDLSSARVRDALFFLDGARNGQPLGGLLGYRFERALHEHPSRRLDRYIEPFRALYPMVAGKDTPTNGPAETVAARTVVDGLALRRAWIEAAIPWGTAELSATGADRDSVTQILRELDRSIDAIADVLTAEAVHQLLRRNTAAGGATLDTLAAGFRAPDPDIVRSPRSGTTLTHRVALLLGTPPVAAGWTASPTPRALAEPHLDGWLGELLGDPTTIRCRVRHAAPLDGDPDHVVESVVSLTALDLRPLDLLAMTRRDDGGIDGELHDRIVFAALGDAPHAGVEVDLAAAPTWDPPSYARYPTRSSSCATWRRCCLARGHCGPTISSCPAR